MDDQQHSDTVSASPFAPFRHGLLLAVAGDSRVQYWYLAEDKAIEDAAFTHVVGAPLTHHLLPATTAAAEADNGAGTNHINGTE